MVTLGGTATASDASPVIVSTGTSSLASSHSFPNHRFLVEHVGSDLEQHSRTR